MTLSPSLRETLRLVADVMGPARDDWWVIAGAAAALHGADGPAVGDVDVLASDGDLLEVGKRLGVEPLVPPPHPLFSSRILVRWTTPPLVVEFMAGFRVRTEGVWREVRPATRESAELDGAALFTPSRSELTAMLRAIGRPKDLERARRLGGR